MPEIPFDFSELPDKQRYAISLVEELGSIPRGMKEAGYKDTNDTQLKKTYNSIMRKEISQKYLKYIRSNPIFHKREMEWFKRDPFIPTNRNVELTVPTHLSDENKKFLENYFIMGDKFRAMKETFPEQGYNEGTRRKALEKASNILGNKTSIEYMNMLNDRALSEVFLTRSKIVLEIYELARSCKDSPSSRFSAVKAYELLARITGLLQENKSSVNVNDGGRIEINYIVPDKIDTSLEQDIHNFLKEGAKDVEYEKWKDDEGNLSSSI